MDILSYLTELIKTRKEVGVPGLGTIYKKKSPGRYDMDTQSFLPPNYTLDFTNEVKEDKLLAELISKKRNISADSSIYYINQFTEDIQNQLKEGKEVEIGELGTLSIHNESIQFSPKDKQSFGFDFYGLPAVKDEISQQVEKENIDESLSTNAAEADEPIITEDEVISFEDEQNENKLDETISEEDEEVSRYAVAVPETEQIIAKEDSSSQNEGTEDQFNLDNNNADLSDGSTEFEEAHHEEKEIDEDEQVYEEIQEAPSSSSFINTQLPVNESISDNKPEEISDAEINEKYTPITPSVLPVAEEKQPLEVKNAPVWNFDENPTFYTSNQQPVTTQKTLPLYLKLIIAIIVLLIALLTVYFLRPDLFKNLINKDSAPKKNAPIAVQNEDKPKVDSIAYLDSVKTSNEKAIQRADSLKKATKDSTVISTVSKSVIPVVLQTIAANEVTTWEVIGASVINQAEADRFIAQMKAVGITAKAVPNMPGKRRIKISIGSFKDEEGAKEGRKLLVEKLKDPGIYIYQNKHTHKPQ